MPGEPDIVFAMGRSIHRCTEGGTKCEILKGAPGGDDYHFLWIDPQHPERMITGADQGAALTTNGGRTWSRLVQPADRPVLQALHGRRVPVSHLRAASRTTARFASRAAATTAPSAIATGSRSARDERDYEIPDPRDPDIVYGSGLGGRLSRWNARNGEVQNVTPWPISSYGERPTDFQQRYSWITPIAMSQARSLPALLRARSGCGARRTRARHWEALGPDLSARGPARRATATGDLDPARARATAATA